MGATVKYGTSNSATPRALVSSIWKHRTLIFDLAKRDVVGRYKGSLLGIVWSLLTPLFMLGIYTLVFSQIFRTRWHEAGPASSEADFAVILFAGLVVFNLFSECVTRAPSVILANANFVKKVVFPLEILPCVNLLSALFHASVSIVVLLGFQLVYKGSIPLTTWMIPFVLLPLMLFVLGISWWLAATGVFMRDIGQTIGILVTGLLFVSPIFFPASALPPKLQFLTLLNPIAYPIELARMVLVWGTPIAWGEWSMYMGGSGAISWIGFAWFQKVRKGFADVI